jgi:hypothetical protein
MGGARCLPERGPFPLVAGPLRRVQDGRPLRPCQCPGPLHGPAPTAFRERAGFGVSLPGANRRGTKDDGGRDHAQHGLGVPAQVGLAAMEGGVVQAFLRQPGGDFSESPGSQNTPVGLKPGPGKRFGDMPCRA